MDINILKDLTNQELNELVTKCNAELEERKRQKKTELIEAFRKAFYDLEEVGIEVSIGCDCCGEDVPIRFNELYIN